MKLIIDIPEVYYEALRKTDEIISGQRNGKTLMSVIYDAVGNGTPLPKGHGRLIDADAIKPKFCNSNIYNKYGEKGFWYYSVKDMNDAPTIIEADKKESEG